MISFQGGPYAFDGTTTPVNGTFVFDFSDIAPASGLNRYYLGMNDNAARLTATNRSLARRL